MTPNIEQQARAMLALGLDEYGHHNEAENVRRGDDLECYKVELFALRRALTPTGENAKHVEVLRQMLHPLLGSKWLCDETKREALEFAIRAMSAPDNAEAVSDHDLPFDTTRKVVRALTRLGVSTPCSQEEQAARAVELVNLLCREILNAPHPPAADEAMGRNADRWRHARHHALVQLLQAYPTPDTSDVGLDYAVDAAIAAMRGGESGE